MRWSRGVATTGGSTPQSFPIARAGVDFIRFLSDVSAPGAWAILADSYAQMLSSPSAVQSLQIDVCSPGDAVITSVEESWQWQLSGRQGSLTTGQQTLDVRLTAGRRQGVFPRRRHNQMAGDTREDWWDKRARIRCPAMRIRSSSAQIRDSAAQIRSLTARIRSRLRSTSARPPVLPRTTDQAETDTVPVAESSFRGRFRITPVDRLVRKTKNCPLLRGRCYNVCRRSLRATDRGHRRGAITHFGTFGDTRRVYRLKTRQVAMLVVSPPSSRAKLEEV
jgi:hypothetical protein